jgi:hypothetical protein
MPTSLHFTSLHKKTVSRDWNAFPWYNYYGRASEGEETLTDSAGRQKEKKLLRILKLSVPVWFFIFKF